MAARHVMAAAQQVDVSSRSVIVTWAYFLGEDDDSILLAPVFRWWTSADIKLR